MDSAMDDAVAKWNYGADDGVPRVQWKPVGDWRKISANKSILLFNPEDRSVTAGYLELSDRDDRGQLLDLNGVWNLSFDSFSHYSYLCLPMDGY